MRSRLTALIAADRVRRRDGGGGLRQQQRQRHEQHGGGNADRHAGHQRPAGSRRSRARCRGRSSPSGELTRRGRRDLPAGRVHRPGRHTTVIGMDADLAKAIAQLMGLTPNVQNVTFDSIIPGLAAGKYDLGMSSFTDTKEREKTVDFVTYLTAGTSFYVKADGGPDLTSLDAPLRPHGRGGEGDDAGGRHRRPGQEVQGGGQAGRHASDPPGPERRQPGPLERPGRRRDGRLAGRRPTSPRSRTASSR